jgi:transcriptional repressor NrdR
MKCPFCGVVNRDRVLETRTLNEGATIKRRRECEACGRRFTTNEVIEELQLQVIKNDRRREPFDRRKIISGIQTACKGRIGISQDMIESVAEDIERKLYNRLDKEVTSQEIGNLVMEQLQQLDHVAYVRFASVYRQFQDATEFKQIVDMLRRQRKKP